MTGNPLDLSQTTIDETNTESFDAYGVDIAVDGDAMEMIARLKAGEPSIWARPVSHSLIIAIIPTFSYTYANLGSDSLVITDAARWGDGNGGARLGVLAV